MNNKFLIKIQRMICRKIKFKILVKNFRKIFNKNIKLTYKFNKIIKKKMKNNNKN